MSAVWSIFQNTTITYILYKITPAVDDNDPEIGVKVQASRAIQESSNAYIPRCRPTARWALIPTSTPPSLSSSYPLSFSTGVTTSHHISHSSFVGLFFLSPCRAPFEAPFLLSSGSPLTA